MLVTLPDAHRGILARVQLALAMLLAGSSVVLSKIVGASVPIYLANTLILLPAVGVLCLLTWRFEGPMRVPPGAWRPLFLQALLGIVGFRVFLFYGVPLTYAASAGILTSTVPAVTALLAWMVLRERLTVHAILGVLLTAFGILVLTVPGAAISEGARPLLGSVLVLGAVVGEASWNVLSRLSGARLRPLTATTLVTSLALVLFLPLGLVEATTFDFARLTPGAVFALGYYALGATVLAYVLWFAGVRHLNASTAAVYTGWLPVSAVALSALLLGERLTLWHALGLACVLCATFVFARQGASCD
ncbi:drug/metabolite transporter (DMT)-like permease [Deinococcus sp. HSC-46F16]|uniref:DMT family transporter n=1 Tax=Deinococcus sp. HSC-46F16 TaxID=2910968 RepID=UPI00209F7130|nr:DMT family transporter [Deinococcus sp. HSC-46F16]MCP2014021.1 drug/metabolite transporter (DMT)-like permease [Deinococcus sp. HSC-46F16]